ncbi:Variant surface glycoprotein [Trypanosoma congolense IL3000]|uniref:Variant surface glycoprotein n=1 Tax=Trypanosoma congolense (strain IL3000) TaxID=1068625 RepID=F9W3I8_TRYCI|nr:Variant surface glycoprotein [Trypanosoma congolense IL3000]
MMFLVIVGMMMMALSGGSLGTGTSEHHNHEEHATLCGLLGAAATLYNSGRAGEKLRKALGQVIFGKEDGGSLADLKRGFPEEYGKDGGRHNSCGECRHNNHDHYPGKSIPHDLLCLCTMGENGAPFNSGGHYSLCGVTGDRWGCKAKERNTYYAGDGQHWDCTNQQNGQSTWHHEKRKTAWQQVVQTCLKRKINLTLKDALDTFKGKKTGGHIINWNRNPSSCGGTSPDTICVGSSGWCGKETDNSYPQWLEVLEELTQEDFKLLERPTVKRRRRRQARNSTIQEGPDAEDDAEEEEEEFTTSTEGTSTTASLDKSRNHLLSLLSKHDGTSLPPPHSWLLSAVFFF